MSGTALKGVKIIKTIDDIMKVSFSPDGAYLAVCTGSKRYTCLYRVDNDYEVGVCLIFVTVQGG